MQVPGVVIENNTIMTLDQLINHVADKAKEQVEKFGSHIPMLIGKMKTGQIGVFSFAEAELPRDKVMVSEACRSTINQMHLSMCCFVMQSIGLDLPNTEEAKKLIEQIKKGEVNLFTHPDSKRMVQIFAQRPGCMRVIYFDMVKEGEVSTIKNRKELSSATGFNLFDFYDHSRVN